MVDASSRVHQAQAHKLLFDFVQRIYVFADVLAHLCLTRREDLMPTAQDQSPATAGNSVRLLALATAQFVIAAFLGQFRCVVGRVVWIRVIALLFFIFPNVFQILGPIVIMQLFQYCVDMFVLGDILALNHRHLP